MGSRESHQYAVSESKKISKILEAINEKIESYEKSPQKETLESRIYMLKEFKNGAKRLKRTYNYQIYTG